MDRWQNTFVIDEGELIRQPAVHDILRRIDRSVAEELAESCAQRLGHWFDHAGSGVWRIRELNLNFTLDLAKPEACEIATQWSEQVAARIAEIIGRGPDGDDGILSFADLPAYLAQFVVDLVAGRAWSKWYYEEFYSLAELSKGRVIADVLTREPDEGAQAIVHLARSGHLDEILPVLTAGDAQLIYQTCIAQTHAAGASGSETSHSAGALSLWSGRMLDVWKEEPMRAASAVQTKFHDALRWLVLVSLRFPDLELDSAACAAVDGLIELRRVLEGMRSPIVADRLVRDLIDGRLNIEQAIAAASSLGVPSPENALRFLEITAQGDGDWAVQAAAVLLRDQLPPAQAILAAESMVTGYGGIFLLGPGLVKLNEALEAAVGQIEEAKEVASFLRYIVLVKCLGSPRTLDAMGDTALRLFSGCHRFQLQDARQACSSLDLDRAHVFLLRNLPALAGCDGHCLIAETVAVSAQEKEIVLLRDVARNDWIYAAVTSSEAPQREVALASGIDLIQDSTGNIPHVLLHPSLAALADSQALRQRSDRLLVLQQEAPSNKVSDVLSSARRVSGPLPPEQYAQLAASSAQELAYFSFAALWPDFDLALDVLGALLSRAAMKLFARRLMGFQTSSPEHLYRNFLEGVGTVRNRTERMEVELPRSPLLLVLQLSGLVRQSYNVPWLEGKEVCLLPPKE